MLKIRDNVDLKKLERYGLRPIYNQYSGEIDEFIQEWGYPFCDTIKKPYIRAIKKGKVIWKLNDRRIYMLSCKVPQNMCNVEKFLDTLYDLIKDGIVEKMK